jgi:hypothetical protein
VSEKKKGASRECRWDGDARCFVLLLLLFVVVVAAGGGLAGGARGGASRQLGQQVSVGVTSVTGLTRFSSGRLAVARVHAL